MPKIVIIGAGSASFGLNTLGSLLSSRALAGSEIVLVDKNPDALGLMFKLAERVNREWDAQIYLSAFTHHRDALPDADFVVSAIEVPPREKLWKLDFEIPLKYGVRQPYAENGGPGGFAHAARNIMPVLEIAHDMEEACPDAWFINFSNPMVRICDAVNRYSRIKVIGLCHQIHAGYALVGYLLAKPLNIHIPDGPFSTHADKKYWKIVSEIAHQAAEKIDIKAAGLNHFTWMVDIRSKLTGMDLYPLLDDGWKQADPGIEPLSRKIFQAFGIMPVPGDEHLDEYLPWCSDPITRPWEKFDLSLYDWDGRERDRMTGFDTIRQIGEGQSSLDSMKYVDSEGAREVIEAITGVGNLYHQAMNLPNWGQIANLPPNSIVETPGTLTGMGAMPMSMGSLPEGAAELARRELAVVKLCTDSVVEGSRQKALQCLLLDPVITDLDAAELILEDYLTTYREHLPTFWQ